MSLLSKMDREIKFLERKNAELLAELERTKDKLVKVEQEIGRLNGVLREFREVIGGISKTTGGETE